MKSNVSYPRAIVHIDGDCFFAACEVMQQPQLKGLPVATGAERGIVSSLTYEAKALGVKRGMPLWQARKICPTLVILPSDYETYSLMSRRMYEIVRRFTPLVEEYSIDECFADLTGFDATLGQSYEQLAQRIKTTLDKELGISFSVGLAPTKVLAKVGSKWGKPSGCTVIPAFRIVDFLDKVLIAQIWGIGPSTANYLQKYGIKTANDFALQNEHWVKNKLNKPIYETWQELRGQSVYEVKAGQAAPLQSISKTKTFTPASNDRPYVLAQLSKNVENACIKLRRHQLSARKFFFFLKSQQFRHYGLGVKLTLPTNTPTEILEQIEPRFDQIFSKYISYRSTGVVMLELSSSKTSQPDLFGQTERPEKLNRLFSSLDRLSNRYGKHVTFLGSSFAAITQAPHAGPRGVLPQRQQTPFHGETARKRLALPWLGEVA